MIAHTGPGRHGSGVQRLTFILDDHNLLYAVRSAFLRHITERAAGGDAATLVVVTRDIKLARRARKRGAAVMAPGEFLEAWGLGE